MQGLEMVDKLTTLAMNSDHPILQKLRLISLVQAI